MRKKALFGLLIGVLLTATIPSSAFALTIAPTKIEVAGDPGQTIIGEIELFNEQSEPKTFFTSYENFEPRGETGSPYFVGGGKGLASWITTQESVTLNAGERVAVPYTITIPADATPGGYFSAIFFGTQPPVASESGAEVSIGGKVGSLVLLRVNGEVAESGGLLDFGTQGNRFFINSLPVGITYRFNNTGGDRVIPRGEITIKNTFGMTTTVLPANQNEGSVLPNSIRRFEPMWALPEGASLPGDGFWSAVTHQAEHFHIGFYRAAISLSWGESQQAATDTMYFFMFPWQLMTVVLVAFVVFVSGLRVYNRVIIARATKQ